MVQQVDDFISECFEYGQARLVACMSQHTLAQVLLLAFCFVFGGLIEFLFIVNIG